MNSKNPQLNENGALKHLLTTEGLPISVLLHILDTAESFVGVTERDVKKIPLLRGKSIFNLFFEPSTRTRTTFEIAAKRLSADVINLNIAAFSESKGETLLDTVNNLSAMNADMFVVRHSQSGAAHLIAKHVRSDIRVINACDGSHAHPTQALLDMFTIRRYKQNFRNLLETWQVLSGFALYGLGSSYVSGALSALLFGIEVPPYPKPSRSSSLGRVFS